MAELDLDREENKKLLLNLYVYSRGLFNQLYKKDPNWKGKSFRDYVHDAIFKYLNDEDDYDPKKSPLEYHLKYHLIRQAITNDIPPHIKKAYNEDRKNSVYEMEMTHKIPIDDYHLNPDELGTLSLFINNIDNEKLFKEIENEMTGDSVVEKIYLAVVCDKYSLSDRSEICADFELSTTDFDNGKRRFITVIRRVFKKLGIKP